MKKINSYSFNINSDTMYIYVYRGEKDPGTLVATINECGKMNREAKDKLAVEVLDQLGYDMRDLNNHLNFETMYSVALANEIDAVGGSIEQAMDNFGIYDNPTKEKVKEWFGWEDEPEDEEEDDLGFDRRKIEKDYHLGEGSLDGIDNLKYIAGIIGCEDGELDRYLWDDDNRCYFYEVEED